MASVQIDEKVVLLISPQRLHTDFCILSCLHIVRSNGKTNLDDRTITFSELKNFPDLPNEARNVLASFQPEVIHSIRDEIRKDFNGKKAGVGFEVFLRNAMSRRIHGLITKLNRSLEFCKWYHSVKDVLRGQLRTAPCTVSTHRPCLQFEVIKNGSGYRLQTHIGLDGRIFPLDELKTSK